MSETFNEIQALQDMEDARIGRSRALQAKAALSALNEPFCNKPEHAALEKALSEANARETNLNTHILTLHVQLAAAIRDRDAYKAALETIATDEDTVYMACADIPYCMGEPHNEGCAVGIAQRALAEAQA